MHNKYLYNAGKSAVIVMNERPNEYRSATRSWSLGNDTVSELNTYKHLGITLSKYCNRSINVEECCQKLRSTFLTLVHCGLFENGIHPLSAKIVYKSIVLPKALYGCELWDALSDDQTLLIERSHRYCIKQMQAISKYTNSDIALSLIGMLPIAAEIDLRKLKLFGQLCRIDPSFLVKSVFTRRLIEYTNNPVGVRGFIADCFKLVGKYNLTNFISSYIADGIFPTKTMWKNTINKQLYLYFSTTIYRNITENCSVSLFPKLHPTFNEIVPSNIWVFSKSNRNVMPQCKSIIQMISFVFNSIPVTCRKCDMYTNHLVIHVMFFCVRNLKHSERLFKALFLMYGTVKYLDFMIETPERKVLYILSDLNNSVCEESTGKYVYELCSCLHAMWT